MRVDGHYTSKLQDDIHLVTLDDTNLKNPLLCLWLSFLSLCIKGHGPQKAHLAIS